MDAEGSKICVEHLLKTDPKEFEMCMLVEDGDSIEKRWMKVRGAEKWICAKCGCHKAKNACKACKGSEMTGLQCKCANTESGGKRCTSIKDTRWKTDWSHRFTGHWHKIMDESVLMYLPELGVPGAALPADVGSPEREHRRKIAIEHAKEKTMAMYYHMTGDHSKGCVHGALDEGHAALKCDSQKEYLWKVLQGLSKCSAEVLTPVGRVDINAAESLNHIIALYRPKGRKWGSVGCFLAETLGLLHWQRLQLGFWGRPRNPMSDLADLIEKQLGLTIPFSKADIAAMEKYLESSLERKEARSSVEYAAATKSYRARKAGYAPGVTASSSGGYVSGGSARAVEALAKAAGMFELTGGDSEEATAPAVEDGYGVGLEVEEGPI
jgi:hypothetical protein